MQDDGLVEALHVAGPAGPHADELHVFGQFVGSWDVVWSGVGADGKIRTARGELHFGWVLGGRAVQEVWIVPGRGQPGEGRPGLTFHGSAMRFYDPATGAWKSTWADPVNGRLRLFTGGLVGGDIVLESDEGHPRLRWRFTRITPDSFTWRGEISHDDGATWTPDEEMLITRRSETAGGLAEALHVAGPAPAHAGELELLGRFAGSWDTEWSGEGLTARGEAHIGWVLGGRAVQELWILPGRGEPGDATPPAAFHGAWIRFYDPSIEAWRAVWMDPVNGDALRFLVRPVGDEIVMLGVEDDPRLRWRFTDIGPDAFSFLAESSRDGGASWTQDEEMRVTRQRTPGIAQA